MWEALQQSQDLLRLVLDSLPVGVAVMDRKGSIILTNPASEKIWGGSIPEGPERYAKSKGWWHETGKRITPEEWASSRARAHGQTSINEVIDIEGFDGSRKTIHNSAIPIKGSHGDITGAVIVNEDISARKNVELELNNSYDQMRKLTAQLMRAQDAERQRIARQLHETTVQDLLTLKMDLARVARDDDFPVSKFGPVLAQSIAIVDRSLQDLRTVSHLLHPPLLEELGLAAALRWYVDSFAARSGISITLELRPFERLPYDVEIAIFRIMQEALSNIHRHSGSLTAAVQLTRVEDQVHLTVSDLGKGMNLDDGGQTWGVGLQAIRERVRQFDGAFDIRSSENGTLLTISLRLTGQLANG
jgi:PAS domain S-box-containing protein